MGDRGSPEDKPSDCGDGSWQGRAPSPGIPISFTQENSINPPHSPLLFSDYFDGPDDFNQMLGSQSRGYSDGSMQRNDLPSHPHFGYSTFNQLLDVPSSSQTPRYIGYPLQPNDLVRPHQHSTQNRQPLQRSLSKDKKYRLRLKAKEQAKDRCIEMLNQQILRMNGELAGLRSENEMLRNNKDEQIARLISEIEMLRKEITSIKHNNLFIH